MTRRVRSISLLVVAILAALPAPALAYDWAWLDSLSGPKFAGPVFEWRFVCFKTPPPDQTRGALAEPEKKRLLSLPLSIAGSIGPTCTYERGERRKGSVQLAFGLLSADAKSRFANNEDVKLTFLTPSFSWQIWERAPLEVGFGAGVYWFSSKGFESFHRTTVEPIRLDFRPFDWSRTNDARLSWLAAAFVLRMGVVVFPQGFEAHDFQDSLGSREPREIKKFLAISIDSEPLIRKLSGTWD